MCSLSVGVAKLLPQSVNYVLFIRECSGKIYECCSLNNYIQVYCTLGKEGGFFHFEVILKGVCHKSIQSRNKWLKKLGVLYMTQCVFEKP